eukprot:929029-Pelagomonas_calceolata.AAC.2
MAACEWRAPQGPACSARGCQGLCTLPEEKSIRTGTWVHSLVVSHLRCLVLEMRFSGPVVSTVAESLGYMLETNLNMPPLSSFGSCLAMGSPRVRPIRQIGSPSLTLGKALLGGYPTLFLLHAIHKRTPHQVLNGYDEKVQSLDSRQSSSLPAQ